VPKALLTWVVVSEERLASIFRAETPGVENFRVEPGLGAAIKDAFICGRSAFPTIQPDEESFARHLARAVARKADGATLATLAIADLYLACACLLGIAGAAETLVALHGPAIRRRVKRVVGRANGEEIVQQILFDLLVGSESSRPELTDYSGRAPLTRWLEVIAHRAAIHWQRTERAQAQLPERVAVQPRSEDQTPTDDALFREQHAAQFQQALKEALKQIPPQDRAILRLHLVNNVRVEKIGKMLGVSQPTASRWLAKARQRVLTDTKLILRETLAISSREIESLARLLGERLDSSIAGLLTTDKAKD
jgi:RNA polymerase sigma-70 factor (ECF subfamily)